MLMISSQRLVLFSRTEVLQAAMMLFMKSTFNIQYSLRNSSDRSVSWSGSVTNYFLGDLGKTHELFQGTLTGTSETWSISFLLTSYEKWCSTFWSLGLTNQSFKSASKLTEESNKKVSQPGTFLSYRNTNKIESNLRVFLDIIMQSSSCLIAIL